MRPCRRTQERRLSGDGSRGFPHLPCRGDTTRTSGEEFFRTEDIYSGLGEPIPGGQIARWLLVEGPHIDSGVELFDELCWRLFGANFGVSDRRFRFKPA